MTIQESCYRFAAELASQRINTCGWGDCERDPFEQRCERCKLQIVVEYLWAELRAAEEDDRAFFESWNRSAQ